MDLTRESFNAPADQLDRRVPYEERVRRGLLIAAGIMFVALTALQVVMGMTVSPEHYQAISGPLAGVDTVVAATLGAAALYYFTRRG